jgi:hypothetical protein
MHQRRRQRAGAKLADPAADEQTEIQAKVRKTLRRTRVLISLTLILRKTASARSIREAAALLRHEGFIVCIAGRALIVTGEPALSLTFMDIVAQARLLSTPLVLELKKIVRSNSWLKAENRPEHLRAAKTLLPRIERVEPPPREWTKAVTRKD